MSRQTYEVRFRVQTGPNKWVKKSRFYNATSPGDARGKYKGPGDIMWVEKVSREKLLGVGEFFRLGDSLLKELKELSTLSEIGKDKERDKVRKKRGFYARQRKTATDIS